MGHDEARMSFRRMLWFLEIDSIVRRGCWGVVLEDFCFVELKNGLYMCQMVEVRSVPREAVLRDTI
jgi:hypothetical protein